VAFDGFKSHNECSPRDLWLAVLKTPAPGIMPPEKKPRPVAGTAAVARRLDQARCLRH